MDNSTFYSLNISKNEFICDSSDPNWSRGLKTFAIFFIGVFGILGNIFIILLAIRYTVRRNLHHLIINMAVADTLVVLSMWAFRKMVAGDITCKVFLFFAATSITVSYTSLLFVSIERFRVSRRTSQLSQPYTLKKRLAVVACAWLISAFLAAMEIPFRTAKHELLPGVYICQETSKVPLVIRFVRYIFFISTISCIFILSVATLRRISHRQAIEDNISQVQRETRRKRIASTTKMVLSSSLLFALAYLPYNIWNVSKILLQKYHNLTKEEVLCYDLNIFSFFTGFLPIVNSFLSPVIYLIFLSDFREAAKKLLSRNVNPVEIRRRSTPQQSSRL